MYFDFFFYFCFIIFEDNKILKTSKGQLEFSYTTIQHVDYKF